MGLLVTAFLMVYLLLAPVFGIWADRFSRWKIIGISLIIQSLASFGTGFSQTFAMLVVMRCVVGIGEAAYGPAAPTLLSDLFPVSKRGKIMAIFYTAIPVGSALGYMIGGLAIHFTGDWRWAFYALGPPGILLGIACFFIKDPPRGGSDKKPFEQTSFNFNDFLRIVKIPSFIYNCAGATLMTFAIGGIAFWMPTYLQIDRKMNAAESTIAFGAIAATAGLIATLAGGMLGDYLRPRFGGSYFLVSGAGMLLGFPLFILVMYLPFPLAYVPLFLAVFCLFLNTGPANTALANVVPAHVRASAFAFNILIIHLLGDAISPWIIGAIADSRKTETSSGLGAGFVLVSITMAVGGVIWMLGAKHLRKDTLAATGVDPVEREEKP